MKTSSPLCNNITRKMASTVIQMRIGHAYTNSYLTRNPTTGIQRQCGCGNRNQTPEHLLLHCQNEPMKINRKALEKAIDPQLLNWITAIHSNPGLRATIDTFLTPTKVATRKWTPTRTSKETNQRHSLVLYNDEIGERHAEREEDGD